MGRKFIKPAFLIMLLCASMVVSSAYSCNKNQKAIHSENETEINDMKPSKKIKIKVNSQTFTATLLDNNSAKAFKALLPMTITMIELNGNEKYYDLPKSLPTNSSNPGTIKNGDLMLFGSKTLVLFYETNTTSYSYTKLGTVDDVKGLADALGSGNVVVVFEIGSSGILGGN